MTDQNQRSVVLHGAYAAGDAARAVSIAEMLREEYPGIRVTIVLNGAALDEIEQLDTSALPDGASVSACSLGLEHHGIDPAKLPEGVDGSERAPVVLVREQLAGAAYIRL
ncbi:hypothetical protein [Leucobacter ruminantium]|uniref:Uncharacterized protein n=1 Tax=Leucobacter ruminantium TaxID=1289170 RepID=A0A939LWN1_9MICO|nr:hypothetical protein [Leucobacter ruminantium]MBO1804528.1 hypothetical protein [Leucobacter ruminantium]